MQKNPIPKTDLQVSPICLGTMTFGTPVAQAEAIALTHWALDHGVNFIDTANMYEGYARTMGSPGGVAEEILGHALKGRREQAILATKVGMTVGPDPEDQGTSPAAIAKQLDRSLARLACEYVDIYYLHRADDTFPLVDILAAMSQAIDAGKVRYYGISNYSAVQTAELLRVADENHLARPVIHQPGYSLLNRGVEDDLLPLCLKEQIAVAPYQVLQGGLLTGKYRPNQRPPAESRQAQKPGWGGMPEVIAPETFAQLQIIDSEARAQGRSLLAHTIKTTLALPSVVSLILGVKRAEQLAELINAVQIDAAADPR